MMMLGKVLPEGEPARLIMMLGKVLPEGAWSSGLLGQILLGLNKRGSYQIYVLRLREIRLSARMTNVAWRRSVMKI
jgi:hypothetical protein